MPAIGSDYPSRCCSVRGAVLLAQHLLVQLAVVVPGQGLDEIDATGTLVVRDAVAAPLDELGGERRTGLDARLRLDHGDHDLAPVVVGDADHADVADRRVLDQAASISAG